MGKIDGLIKPDKPMGHMVNQIIFMFDQCITSNVNTMEINKQSHKQTYMNTYFDFDGMGAKNKCMKIDSNKATKPKTPEKRKRRSKNSAQHIERDWEKDRKEMREENRTSCLK